MSKSERLKPIAKARLEYIREGADGDDREMCLFEHIDYLEQSNREAAKRIADLEAALQCIADTGMDLYENRVAEEALERLKSDR